MKRIKRAHIIIACCAASLLTASCGKSLYGAFAKKETNESKLENAKIALDNSDFETARSILSGLWDSSKSNEVAQLYVISMLGTVNLDIFSLIKKTLALTDTTKTLEMDNREIYTNFPNSYQASGTSSSKSTSTPGNSIVDNIKKVLPTDINNDNVTSTLKTAILVLSDAPDKTAAMPLTCFVGAIYTNLVLTSIETTIKTLRTSMSSNLAKLGTSCTTTDGQTAGNNIKASLTSLSNVTAAMDELVTAASGCLGAQAAVNSIKTSLDALYAKADTGCTIPTTGNIGGFSFPTCANTFIESAGGSSSKAGDKALDGCELFVNCVGTTASCF